jgi:imidazolonepropionase-like amidohydrolase
MNKIFSFILLISSLSCLGQNIQWENGNWFNGKGFEKGTFYSTHGILTRKKPAHIDSIADLNGKYVIPPLAEAHHHGIDGEDGLDEKIQTFLHDGVFYVKNPNVIPDLLTPTVRNKINQPQSIDVVFSNGGLTSTGGHPVDLHDMLAKQGVFKRMGPADMENHAYFIIDSREDLEKKWPMIMAGHPDFIKTFLLFSEEFEKRKNQRGFKGLDPEVLKMIVQKAHHYGLRVSTHIETAVDFKNAVAADVDEINHIPIPRKEFSADLSAYVIDEATAREAARKNISVVATVLEGSIRPGRDSNDLRNITANEMHNCRTLYHAGVRLAVGSDGISGFKPMTTVLNSLLYMNKNQFFDALTLLKIATENSAYTIYPKRKIGHLKEGYEANFLILNQDPLGDFNRITDIYLRVKQGKVLF